jgi:hypothetical protein
LSNSLQQLNIQFEPIQDRLILRILGGDNSELRIWLTRRYTRLLLGVLDTVIETKIDPVKTPYVEQMKEFEREAALSGSNFEDKYKADEVIAFPLGEEPILVSRIDYKKLENGNVALTLGVEKGQNINLNLDKTLLHALVKLLNQGCDMAEWNIGTPTLPQQKTEETVPAKKSEKILH